MKDGCVARAREGGRRELRGPRAGTPAPRLGCVEAHTFFSYSIQTIIT